MAFSVPLTVPAGKVSADLAGFPMLIDLSLMAAEFWDEVASDGGNIRAFKNGVELPIDVVDCRPDFHEGDVFVRVDLSASSATTITVQLVPGATKRDPTDPLGGNAVWASTYEAVVHFKGTVTGDYTTTPWTYRDRTGHGHNFQVGGATASVAGVGSGFYGMVVANDGWAMATVPHLAAYTMGACAIQANRNSHNTLLSYNNSATTTGRHSLLTQNSNNWASWNGSFFDTGVLSDINVPHHVALRSSSANGRQVFRDGVQLGGSGTTGTVPSAGTTFLVGSSQTNNTEDWDGSIRLAYLKSGISSAAWLKAEADSWIYTSTFYTVPPENLDVDPAKYITGQVIVPAGKVASTLTDFVTRVRLSDLPAAWWSNVAAGGANIRFRLPGDTTYRPLDLVKVDPATKTGDAYVRVTLSPGTATTLLFDVTTKGLTSRTSLLRGELVWQDYAAVVMPRQEPLANRANRNATVSQSGTLPEFAVSARFEDPDAVHQGVAVNPVNGERILLDTNEFIRYDADWNELARNSNPQGQAKAAGASATIGHIGDGCIVDGELIVGMDNYPSTTIQWVGVFDAATLAYKRGYDILALNGGIYYQFSSLCWTGTEFITVNFSPDGPAASHTVFERWSPSWTHIATVTHSTASGPIALPNKQGVTVLNGKLYLSVDGSDTVWRCNMDGTDAAVAFSSVQEGGGTQNQEGISTYNGGLLLAFDHGSATSILSLRPVAETGTAFGIEGGYLMTAAAAYSQFTLGATGIAAGDLTKNAGLVNYGASTLATGLARETLGHQGALGPGLWNNSDNWLTQTGAPIPAFTPTRLHATHDGTTERRLWRNGVSVAVDTPAANPAWAGIIIGVGGASEPWYGFAERVYVRSGLLSADWLAAEVLNWETPASFYAAGLEGDTPPPPGGATLPVWDGAAIVPLRVGVAQADGSIKWAASVGRSAADLSIQPLP